MRIPGIPPSNISIDETNHLITVLLPPSLPALDLIPTFTVSEQAKMGGEWGAGKSISFKNYCPCINSIPTVIENTKEVQVNNLTHTSYYTITLKNQGPLTLKPLPTPIVYDAQAGNKQISFQVENYYGSSFVVGIAITRVGSSSPNWIGLGSGGCFDTCPKRLNELGIYLAGYSGTGSLQPGLHDLDLVLYDGTRVHTSGAVLVK